MNHGIEKGLVSSEIKVGSAINHGGPPRGRYDKMKQKLSSTMSNFALLVTGLVAVVTAAPRRWENTTLAEKVGLT